MSVLGWIITVGTVLFCIQLLAVLVCMRFGAMRGRALVEPFVEEPPAGPSVWDALDRHLAAPRDTAAEDQAIAVAATSNDDHFVMWEAELADDKGIARHVRRMDRWSR